MNITEETVADYIAKILTRRIVTGEMGPGQKLRQDYIAQEFGASHVPVREAFRRLESRGLVVSEPRRGVRVSSFNKEDIAEIIEMRSTLEALALRHAIPHITPLIIDKAEQWIRKGDAATQVTEWEEANRQFHLTILMPCKMPRLLRTIEDLHIMSSRHLFAGWRVDWDIATDRDHRAIVNALRAKRGELAAQTLAQHVKRSG